MMGFIKLHDAEIKKLATGGPKGKSIAGDGWALYCLLRRYAWEQQKGKEDTKGWRRYYSYPSQKTICDDLGWPVPAKRPCGNWDTSQKVSRASKKLVDAGLVVVVSAKDNSKRARWIRSGLKRSQGRGHVYHLCFWEEIMTNQKGHDSRVKNDSNEIKNDMSAMSKKICKEENTNSLIEKKNNKSNINMKETFESSSGFTFTKEELKEMVAEDSYRAEQILLCLDDWDEIIQVNDWLGEFRREGLKTEEIQRRLTEKLMNS